MEKHQGKEIKKENTTDSPESEETDVPDGGWGWAVCFGSFLMNFILDGTMFSFGVLLLELLDYFGEGKAKTSWVGSSQLGMSMFMGPVVSMLLERYSCRQITIAGTLLSVAAFIASTFSSNVELLIITYGVIGGIGFSMSFICAIIVVGTYFRRKRAIATGIAMSGSGFGTFAYAYLTNFLLEKYGWRGTILILSAILLNGILCGALFRPMSTLIPCKSESVSNPSSDCTEAEEIKYSLLQPCSDGTYFKNSFLHSRLANSMDFLSVEKDLMNENNLAKTFSSQYDCRNLSETVCNQMSRKDIFYSGSLSRLAHDDSHQLQLPEHCETKPLQMDEEETYVRNAVDVLRVHRDLFKDKVFILLLFTNVCWTVQSVPLTYLPDLAVSKGLSTSQAALLISIVGITNIFGRIISGLVTDLLKIKSSVTYTITLFTASLVNFTVPWCDDFVKLAVCGALFGLCMATAVSMRTIVLADHLGIEKLTKAFGMIALFQGIAFMTNAPLAGFLYETSKSYVMPFCFAGGMYFLSATFCLIMLCLDRRPDTKTIEIVVDVK